MTNKMQIFRLFICIQSSLHLVHDTGRQQHRWTISETVNTVKCSWWWANTSPEICRADWVQINKPNLYLVGHQLRIILTMHGHTNIEMNICDWKNRWCFVSLHGPYLHAIARTWKHRWKPTPKHTVSWVGVTMSERLRQGSDCDL